MVQLMSQHDWKDRPIVQGPSSYYQLADSALVEGCLRGDDPAWEALLDRYGSLIYSIAKKFNLPPEDLADTFQSVCLAMLESLEKLKDEPTLSSWLTTITLWQCRQLVESDQVEEKSTHQPPD
ncbi:MAG: sigma-70 family RNA polymerase sigma factor [Acidobacteria bacterium]|nr:sigma-70 family RNA polymerase sigma factor [Acidobacteriota bacterium]